ncbi:hypothetical protein QI30_06035 [Kurthia sp. 3B1D]|uniref:Uncharacterized protein n=1 Tax=Candidatus Kurthia intestinigallinarum TaxID=1562256 RepID=A0A433RV49_9BACL|nr:hypothetical protein [Kurthia sp. 3B1D]RUS57150.1 hypothetical protein QI30_06035 [Kurthia sp. 3B1D]
MSEFKRFISRTWKNAKKDIKAEANQQFKIDFEGHQIVVQSTFDCTTLVIDDEVIDEKYRPTKLGKLRLSETVKGQKDGLDVKAKVGGTTTLDCTFYINGKKIIKQKREIQIYVWKHRTKIIPFLIETYEKNGSFENIVLPDDDYYFLEDDERLAPGEYCDRLFSLEEQGYEDTFAKRLVKKVDWLLEKPADKTRNDIYEVVMDDDFPEYAFAFKEQLAQLEVDEDALYKEAKWFMEHAAHRYVVDFALLLLGRTTVKKDLEMLRVIGRHEEFTAFVAAAIMGHGADANEILFDNMKHTKNYGQRAALILLNEPITEEMQQWLLYDIPLTSDLDVVTVAMIAQKSSLATALKADVVSEALFERATAILVPLVVIEELAELYDELPDALLDYVRHAKTHITSYEQVHPLAKIALSFAEYDWEEVFESSTWQPVEKNLVTSGIQSILMSSNWQPKIDKAFAEGRNMAQAIDIAHASGYDYIPLVYKKIVNGNFEPYLYEALIVQGDYRQFIAVVDYVEQFELSLLNPVERECIELVIDALASHDGVGKTLMHHALQLDDEMLEWRVLTTFDVWKVSSYLPDFEEDLKKIVKKSPDREHRRFAKRLLKGHD